MTIVAPVIYNPPEPNPPEPNPPAELSPTVPYSREAEEAVIGCVLINPNCLYDLSFLQPADFYVHRLRWIWEAFRRMDARHAPIDLLTVADELERAGQLSEMGGPAFLTSLINIVPTSLNAESYARVVEENSIRRRVIAAANLAAQTAYDMTAPIVDVTACLSAASETITVGSQLSDFVQLRDLFSQTYDDIVERSKNPRDVWGFATGLPTFDRATGGIQQGELIYLPGNSGVGKTWLMLGWALEFGRQAEGVIVSMEMKRLAIGRRLLSGDTGVSTRAMRSGRVTADNLGELLQSIGKHDQTQIWLDDHIYNTDGLYNILRVGRREHGWKWLLLDYALLLTDRGENETERTNNITSGLNRIKQELDMAVVVLHHTTKTNEYSAEPTQGGMRGSQRQVDGADMQLFLTRCDERDEAVASLPAEQRAGMRTLWCTKGKEIEESNFKVHLVRRGASPFWGEYSPR